MVGAGMAGLCAARVLADSFEAVTLLERDLPPDDALARRGVPQSRHPHVLLEAGRSTFEDLFPGFSDDVRAAGGALADATSDINMWAERGFLAHGNRQLTAYCASRPLYEQLVRRQVVELEGVRLRTGCRFVDYAFDPHSADVTGVVVREGDDTSTVEADLVVDATGRTSRTPAWLSEHGYDRPAVEEVHVDLAYSTASVERPEDDRRLYLIQPSPPRTRGAAAIPTEGGRWLVTLIGFHGDHPPREGAAYEDFASSLSTPAISQLLDHHDWSAEQIDYYPFPSSRRYRYEALDRFPGGLVVVGDAVASFNPVYGQGMSVGALESVLLHHALRADGLTDVGRRFFDRAASVIDVAWMMAVGADARYPETDGPRPRGTAVFNRYLARLVRGAHTDGVLTDAFYQVITMERQPTSLLHPRVAAHVVRPRRRA